MRVRQYSLRDISGRPFAVIVSILIGLNFSELVVITKLYYDKEHAVSNCEKAVAALNNKIIESNAQTLDMYERLILSTQQVDSLKQSDSLVRQMTGPYVKKILKNAK